MKIKIIQLGTALLATVMLSSSAFATPFCHACPFDCEDLQLGHKDCSRVDSTPGACCVDLTQKGLDRAHDYSRGDNCYNRAPPPPPPAWQQRQETCPSGYRPSEQKCSPEERRRGCKDIRLNSGLGCVKR